MVRPTVPLLFSSAQPLLPVSVPRTALPQAPRTASGSGNGSVSASSARSPGSGRVGRKTRDVMGLQSAGSESMVSAPGRGSDTSHEGGPSVNWPCIAAAAGAGVLIGGGIGWLIAHAFFGSKVIAPAAVHSVPVGGGAAPPVPVSVAAAGATSAGSAAGGTAAADAALKAATTAKAGSSVISSATAAGAGAGAAAAAAAASSAMNGATAAALATPFVTPAITVSYVTAASSGAAITGACIGAAIGGVGAGASGYALLPAAQQGKAITSSPRRV
eukprot:TRINITY_DN2780_c2_g1_i2.p1 TRINITY_DN2780_c2_g1~~TRINITY_DN2780_c2_g1_i2.p1  ORF type:complete len:273 (+),score=40.78 TRINITY_DN2780_c2_g1_i2:151-969(+)